jgi:hypothetical protein
LSFSIVTSHKKEEKKKAKAFSTKEFEAQLHSKTNKIAVDHLKSLSLSL